MSEARVSLMTFVVGGTDPAVPRQRWLRVQGVDLVAVADALVAFAVFAGTYSWLVDQNSRHHGGHADLVLVLISSATAAPLVLRDRYPLLAWECCVLARVVAAIVIPSRSISSVPSIPASLFVYLLCLYSLGVRCRREIAIVAAVVTVLGQALTDMATVATALPMLIPLLLGYMVRSRRMARAEVAEVRRRSAAERAVLEERQRIAREMHDVVAHHMSLIAIQAEAAPLTVPDMPGKTRNDLAEIRATALEALTELRRVLGVLRADDDAETAPQPGLDRLDDLVDRARAAGLTVEMSVSGVPEPLGSGTELAAYRIVQESLSNAMRYARGAAVRIEIAHAADALHLAIVNNAGAVAAMRGSGRGLVGIRERVAMLGGELETGPLPDGGYQVRAVLPVYQRSEGRR